MTRKNEFNAPAAQHDLTPAQYDALCVLETGMASCGKRTENYPDRWVRCIQTAAADALIKKGLAAPVRSWRGAVEITEAGRAALAALREQLA